MNHPKSRNVCTCWEFSWEGVWWAGVSAWDCRAYSIFITELQDIFRRDCTRCERWGSSGALSTRSHRCSRCRKFSTLLTGSLPQRTVLWDWGRGRGSCHWEGSWINKFILVFKDPRVWWWGRCWEKWCSWRSCDTLFVPHFQCATWRWSYNYYWLSPKWRELLWMFRMQLVTPLRRGSNWWQLHRCLPQEYIHWNPFATLSKVGPIRQSRRSRNLPLSCWWLHCRAIYRLIRISE